MKPSVECSCLFCVSACWHVPGFLAPSDLQPLADFLGVTLEVLRSDYLDAAALPSDTYQFGLRPRRQVDGSCIFLDQSSGCGVHNVKPTECAEMDCQQQRGTDHEQLASAWREYWRSVISAPHGSEGLHSTAGDSQPKAEATRPNGQRSEPASRAAGED